jgi:hypothetical protein
VSETLTPAPAPAPVGDEAHALQPSPRARVGAPAATAAWRALGWRLLPVALASLVVTAFALVDPHPVDLAAGTYRAELFGAEGFTVWNGGWYGGHHTPVYSTLFPPLAWLLGPAVVGAIAAVASAALFEALARAHFGRAARFGAAWFGLGTGTLLFTGRMPFALGLAIGLGALLALQRGRVAIGVVLAALCALASPVAGLFAAIAAMAHALTVRAPRSAAVAAGALAPPLVLALAFAHPGRQFFLWTELAWLLGCAAAVFAVLPARERTLRAAALLYAAAGIAAFVVASPLGNNVVRLGPLVAGPIVGCALVAYGRRSLPRVAVAAGLGALAYALFCPAVEDLRKVHGDPAAELSYYAPLVDYLERAGGPPGRVEIPFTRAHWETAAVAPRYPLARGWERQHDVERHPIFYGDEPLTAAAYGRWLTENGVRWVAVPDAALDFSSHEERDLIDRGLPYLVLRARLPHWRVYEHTGRRALAAPEEGARLTVTALDAGAFTVRTERPGSALVRVRWTPYWRGHGACAERAPGGWTRLTTRESGTVRVSARFSPGRLISRGRRCARSRR